MPDYFSKKYGRQFLTLGSPVICKGKNILYHMLLYVIFIKIKSNIFSFFSISLGKKRFKVEKNALRVH